MAAAAIGASISSFAHPSLGQTQVTDDPHDRHGLFVDRVLFVPSDGIVWMFALQLAIGLVLGPKSPLAWSMYADTADYNEWRTGRRATAMTFAAATFSQKLGTALAAGMMGWVFTALGYVANKAQSSRSQTGIVLLMSIIPLFSLFWPWR
jgi:GPH family glycoside/pentoside/hexuronide:cation symporter